MSVYDRLKSLNIELPPVAVPAAAYVPFVQTGHLVFLSGHIARREGRPWVGQLGKTMTTEAAKRSFRTVFSELRQKLVAAPAALAAQLNPQDPHHAQGVMENYIRSLFKETYEDHQPTA